MIMRRFVPDVSILMKFLYGFIISCNTGNFSKLHKTFTKNAYWAYTFVIIPILNYCNKQADMYGTYTAIIPYCIQKAA